jgi:hypothetical protein
LIHLNKKGIFHLLSAFIPVDCGTNVFPLLSYIHIASSQAAPFVRSNMPQCSTCGGICHKVGFSKAQLRKPNTIRRCKECVEGEVGVGARRARAPASLDQNVGVPGPARASNSYQLAIYQELVDKLLSPERIRGVPEDLRQPAVLRDHLLRVLAFTERTAWLVSRLIKGLLQCHSSINLRIIMNPLKPDNPTILVFVSQPKFLNRNFGWQGGNEIVSMVLATPGVDVNAVVEKKFNAAFFAVIYGTPKILDLLIEAGINMQHRDYLGRTVLCTALDYPNPEMLRRVLDHVPATEMFPCTSRSDGREIQLSASDRILGLYAAAGSSSWINLGGPPSVQDVAESLILVRQRGASFTPEGSEVAWISVRYAFRGGKEGVIAPEDLVQLAKSILGFWLPRAVQDQVNGMDEEVTGQQPSGTDNISPCTASTTGECPICLDPVCKETALYCGHSFCRQCIIEYGKRSGKACPVCRQRLCKDISPRTEDDAAATDINASGGNLGNIDSDMGIMEAAQLRGISALSDSQVSEETKIQGIYSIFSSNQDLRRKLLDKVIEGHDLARRTAGKIALTVGDRCKVVVLELSAILNITCYDCMVIAPSRGPVIVEIAIKGVPVVAHISNNSRYTTISASVAKTFNLKRLEKLRSLAFRDALTGKRVKKMRVTCLEKFIFSVGGIEVTLRNAVEIDPDMDGIGVQLGQDFFLSAALCAVDVQIPATGSGSNIEAMRTDGICSWMLLKCDSENSEHSESLRYYAHGGKTARLPLLRFNPHTDAEMNAITLTGDTTFTECSWCCRTFPEGMRSCPVCYDAGEDVYYCDERCQKAAWKVHKANKEGH